MTAPLRERDGALALLASAAERARAGTGGLVLLRGATGTGRTSVLERAARHAEGLGMRVLHARCSPEYSCVPFGTLLHLLDAPEDAGPAPDGTRGAAERLWRLLLSYTAETPLLLAVDDAHLLDDHSRLWLAETARRVDRLPVLEPTEAELRHDREAPVLEIQAECRRLRQSTTSLLRSLPDVSWQRTGYSRSMGTVSIRGLAEQLLLHDQLVLAALNDTLDRVGARHGIAEASKASLAELQRLSPAPTS